MPGEIEIANEVEAAVDRLFDLVMMRIGELHEKIVAQARYIEELEA